MLNANWIRSSEEMNYAAVAFEKEFKLSNAVKSAVLRVSARGVYVAMLNGKRVGDFIMAPGWTVYEKQIQVQEYNVTDMLCGNNKIELLLTKGWYLSRISTDKKVQGDIQECINERECAVIAELAVEYIDGKTETVATDSDWLCFDSKIRFCDIYDGEIYDASYTVKKLGNAVVAANNDRSALIPQIGEAVKEQDRLKPVKVIHTPCGETVLDFGQNMTGYLEFTVTAKAGDKASFSFAEILDKHGNFYNANYRTAQCIYEYTCSDGVQTHKPCMNFYGFRFVRIDEFPCEIDPDAFTAIAVHSELRRTGRIYTSDPYINRLFSNVIWGQKSNYLDIPTDCPQRDERLGWTGDAEVFIKTASYNYDVEKFFIKWFSDMRYSQSPEGVIPSVIPNAINSKLGNAAWGDAVTICPWQLYLTYGNTVVLKDMFPAMKRWVDWIAGQTKTPFLWTGQFQFGDWLELNAEPGKRKGKTRDDLLASAFYANSVNIICKVGRVIGEDISEYEKLYKKIVRAFKDTYKNEFKTQTEYVLALHFDLVDDKSKTAELLARQIANDGNKIQTGFVGSTYILHALSENGYSELAYSLLLRKRYPSWLYPVTKGATTIWEHWDGIKPNGDPWPVLMNSYNHYAYGAVADWMYEVAAGINTVECAPGFKEILFKPVPTDKIEQFGAEIDTREGSVSSRWWHEGGEVRYEIITPSPATAIINGKTYKLSPGNYRF